MVEAGYEEGYSTAGNEEHRLLEMERRRRGDAAIRAQENEEADDRQGTDAEEDPQVGTPDVTRVERTDVRAAEAACGRETHGDTPRSCLAILESVEFLDGS